MACISAYWLLGGLEAWVTGYRSEHFKLGLQVRGRLPAPCCAGSSCPAAAGRLPATARLSSPSPSLLTLPRPQMALALCLALLPVLVHSLYINLDRGSSVLYTAITVGGRPGGRPFGWGG